MNPHMHNGLIIESIDANDFEFAGIGCVKILADEEIWKYYTPQIPITENYLIQQIKRLDTL